MGRPPVLGLPEGLPSAEYKRLWREYKKLNDPEWYANERQKNSDRAKRKMAALTPEERREVRRKSQVTVTREQQRIYEAAYRQRHPDRISAKHRNRRAAKISGGEGISPEQWEQIKSDYDFRCAYCFVSPVKLTQDHVVPLSAGGLHDSTNVVPACGSCNSAKGTMSVNEFILER